MGDVDFSRDARHGSVKDLPFRTGLTALRWRYQISPWQRGTDMQTAEHFSETTTSIARGAGVLEETVRHYGDLRLIEFIKAANGMRLYRPSAAGHVREIYMQRMAKRGRPRRVQVA